MEEVLVVVGNDSGLVDMNTGSNMSTTEFAENFGSSTTEDFSSVFPLIDTISVPIVARRMREGEPFPEGPGVDDQGSKAENKLKRRRTEEVVIGNMSIFAREKKTVSSKEVFPVAEKRCRKMWRRHTCENVFGGNT